MKWHFHGIQIAIGLNEGKYFSYKVPFRPPMTSRKEYLLIYLV